MIAAWFRSKRALIEENEHLDKVTRQQDKDIANLHRMLKNRVDAHMEEVVQLRRERNDARNAALAWSLKPQVVPVVKRDAAGRFVA